MEEANSIAQCPYDEEIWGALKTMKPFKVPGTDGLHPTPPFAPSLNSPPPLPPSTKSSKLPPSSTCPTSAPSSPSTTTETPPPPSRPIIIIRNSLSYVAPSRPNRPPILVGKPFKPNVLLSQESGDKAVVVQRTQTKTLLIWGEKDNIFPLFLAHQLQRHLGPKSRLAILKDSGHAVNIDSPNMVNELIKSFVLV
nr:hypothetical protein CFP56_64511 [Quercus suber]